MSIRLALLTALFAGALSNPLFAADEPKTPSKDDAPKVDAPKADAPPPRREPADPFGAPGPREPGVGGPRRPDGEGRPPEGQPRDGFQPREGGFGPRRPDNNDPNNPHFENRGGPQFGPGNPMGPPNPNGFGGGRRPGPNGPFGNPQDIEQMKESDPEMYKFAKDDIDLEKKSFDLSEQIRRTMKTEDKEKLKSELQTVVESHFQVRQERREMELKRLEEQIERMRDSVKKRADSKDEIIKQRLGELTGEKENPF